MAADILRHVRATSKINAKKEIFQPEPNKSKIETKRERGRYMHWFHYCRTSGFESIVQCWTSKYIFFFLF